ncbi:hypothetical protein SAMN04488063_2143 [Halopelagius inordinatus]|uniref:Uncharacterized protein n=1 Tax=Halopelagius inordinatus TaxID=553467 RepID=A0A1I2S1F8_9EURY|nr:hypothetical protein [Halopelagius inordinatus]SFG46714.1 hypothetical protein SAMN04488063_2143 [Halopelagius inordinatus]
MALRERLRPWHGLLVAVFLVGTAWSLSETADPFSLPAVVFGVFYGLLWAVGFQFTVGILWAYAVEYHNAGGSWTDLPFVAPFAVALVAGVAVGVAFEDVGVGAWAAFWTFVVAAAAVAVAVWIRVGYRESAT